MAAVGQMFAQNQSSPYSRYGYGLFSDYATSAQRNMGGVGVAICTPPIGMGIAKINALTTEDDSVLVTIITDGEENCSEEYNLKMIKNLIEKLKKQNWTFTFIGTDDLDVENIAHGMGIDNHLQFSEDEAGTKAMFARENRARERYNKCRAMDCKMEAGSYFEEK